MNFWLLFGLLLNGQTGTPAAGPASAGATVQFAFDRPATKQTYHFVLHEDGSGTYTATYPPTPPVTPGETVDVPLVLHAGTTRKLFEEARSTIVLHGNCETRAKNIAQTGAKTLTYTDSNGVQASCTWNYSEKTAVAGLQDEFLAMAETLNAARNLKREQRFDRLGMDRETTFLLQEAQAGRARGLENITPLLDEILADTSLLERVRAKAKILLDLSRVER